MNIETCPSRSDLEDLLLGRSCNKKRVELEQHYLNCSRCVANSQEIAVSDELTDALANEQRFSGYENILEPAITKAKALASLLDTVTDGHSPTHAMGSSQMHSQPTRTLMDRYDFLAPAEQADEIGRFGHYRVLEVLGVGGMGIVFRAEDDSLKRQIALKVMKPLVALKKDSKRRFLREAKATAALSHDNVVQVYQVGEINGTPFIAMQYLAGQSLHSVQRKSEKLPAVDVARLGREIASGLAAAHEKGLIHRDIKPDNVWIEEATNRVKILDFGLARDTFECEELTQSGQIVGTPGYMAPEQINGQRLDARCDLFSLGSTLYHLASGHRAFASVSLAGLLHSIVNTSPIDVRQRLPELDPSLANLIMQLLAKDPNQRPQSAALVVKQFRQIEKDLRSKQKAAKKATTPGLLQPKPNSAHKPPITRWHLVALASAAFFAFVLGLIVITIRHRNGETTTVAVTDGAALKIDVQPGSIVAITEEQPIGRQADGPSSMNQLSLEQQSNEKATTTTELSDADAYPPLEQWLEGRKQITVSQDGSADFTTIQEALDAQNDGEVVRILDKGPYRESLRWEKKKDCGLIASPGTVIEVSKWSTESPEDKVYIRGHHFSDLQDVRVHGVDFLCPIDFTDTRRLIMAVAVDGMCLENCVFASTDLGMDGVLQAINIYPTGWYSQNANAKDFKGNCVRNCVIAADQISLMKGGGTTYFARNLIMFGAAAKTDIYTLGFSTHPAKVADTLLLSNNVFVHHGGESQFYVNSERNPDSKILMHHNTFHGVTQNLAVIYDGEKSQVFEFFNNLSINSSSFVYVDAKFAPPNNSNFRVAGNQSNTSEHSSGSQWAIFKPSKHKIVSTSPLARDSLRIESAVLDGQNPSPIPGALPPGPVPSSGDWFTALQDRFKVSSHHMTAEAREYWTRPLID